MHSKFHLGERLLVRCRACLSAGFWAVAFAFMVAAAFSIAPSSLYGLFAQDGHLSSLTLTLVYAVYAACPCRWSASASYMSRLRSAPSEGARRIRWSFPIGRWRGGELHRDAEPAGGPGGEGEGSVVCLGDALDDGQAEADTCVVGAYAFGPALERLVKR